MVRVRSSGREHFLALRVAEPAIRGARKMRMNAARLPESRGSRQPLIRDRRNDVFFTSGAAHVS